MAVPNTFSPTTTILSAEVNDNFSYLLRDITTVEGTTDISIASGTPAAMSEMSITKTVASGDVLALSFTASCINTSNGDVVGFYFAEGGTEIVSGSPKIRTYIVFPSNGLSDTCYQQIYYTTSASGSTQYDVYWSRVGGGGTISNSCSSGTAHRIFNLEIIKD